MGTTDEIGINLEVSEDNESPTQESDDNNLSQTNERYVLNIVAFDDSFIES